MDHVLSKAASASRRLNIYTGTDYTGIEALRRAIIDQEQQVKTSHLEVSIARTSYTQALAQQSSSQKEVVGLLERKASWTASDLERYMSLIRSEHVNEQAVQAAATAVTESERALEAARSTLEKRERRQYHEEQVWSDTIRRNSTWVTFGLMGLNIVLLLVNLVVFEPWRRRRLVKEFRAAMDEKTIARPDHFNDVPAVRHGALASTEDVTQQGAVAGQDIAIESEVPHDVPMAELMPDPKASPASTAAEKTMRYYWTQCQLVVEDWFSERSLVVKQVDITRVALQSAASGMAIMGLLFVMLQTR